MATFGDTNIYGTGLTLLNADEYFAGKLTTPSDCIRIVSIHFYGQGVGAPRQGISAIWEGTTNPGALIAEGPGAGDTITAAGDAWQTLTFTTYPTVSANTPYWFGFVVDGACSIPNDGGTGGAYAMGTDAFADGPDDPANTPSSNPPELHGFYVTYEQRTGNRRGSVHTLKRMRMTHLGGI